MSGPYPDILFHFTSLRGLKGIIKDGFRPSYAREKIVSTSAEKNIAVPMVSFCDLRLSELPFHMKKYGRFGIGMTKSWAQSAGLNPVAYVNKDSEFITAIITGLESYSMLIKEIGDWNKMIAKTRDGYWKLLNIVRYTKNYEGELIRKSKSLGNYRFADEREWRYVLPLDTKNILPFMPTEFIKSIQDKEFYNHQIASLVLLYNATDVKYIIVENERNIRPMREYIDSLNHTYSASEKNHLLARILTASQIKSDM